MIDYVNKLGTQNSYIKRANLMKYFLRHELCDNMKNI